MNILEFPTTCSACPITIEKKKNIKLPELKINDRFSKIFPPLDNDTLLGLEMSLLKEGCRDCIVTWKDNIADGHNRYKLCKKNNISFMTLPLDKNEYLTENDVEIWMRQNSKNRRNLSDFTSIDNATKLESLLQLKEIAKKQQIRKPNSVLSTVDKTESINTQKEVAKLAGVSIRKVAEHDVIVKNITDEDTLLKLHQGKLDPHKVYKKYKNDEYHKKEDALKDTSHIEITSDLIKGLYNTDILDAPVDDESIDVILTDPPYPYEFINCWEKLAEFAVKKLKPGGILISLSGHSYLPEVYKNMTIEGLDYHWTGAIYQPGTSADLCVKRLNTHWKPILIYSKGKYTRSYQGTDTYISDYDDTKDGQKWHKWGQNYEIFNKLVQDWTYANEVICDPFLGGATTAIAAINNKRKIIGIEIDKNVFELSKKRINQTLESE